MNFIDRDRERKELTELMKSPNNKIIFLTGRSGVGKSGLMQHLFNTSLKKERHIRIRISKSAINTIENGYYFNLLYKQILENEKFLNRLFDNKRNKKRILKGFFEFFLYAIKYIVKILLSIFRGNHGISDAERIVDLPLDSSIIKKRDYIVTFLRFAPCIINIENIQNIDNLSVELLCDIIKRVEKTCFVFEYTIEDNSEKNFDCLWEDFQGLGSTTLVYEINALDTQYATQLLPKREFSEQEIEKAIKAYKNSCGNLFQVILFDIHQNENNPDSILLAIEQLTHDCKKANELYILDIIYLNGGSFHCQTLKTFVLTVNNHIHLSPIEYKKSISNLSKKNIIKQIGAEWVIHDSIIKTLDSQSNTPSLYNAYRELTDYYMTWSPTELIQRHDRLFHLFSLFLRFADSQLLTILPEIRTDILSAKYPCAIYDQLKEFSKELERHQRLSPLLFENICFLLTEICLKIGDVQDAQKNLSRIPHYQISSLCKFLQAKIYELGMTRQEIKKIGTIIDETQINSRQRLLLQLCKLHVMMRICSQGETLSYIKLLIENATYRTYPEYSFLLSDYAELIDSPSKAIEQYKQSIQLLKKHGMERYTGRIYANICMSSAYLGDLDGAILAINKALSIGIDEVVYLNNVTAIQLLKGIANEQTSNSLKDALLLTCNHFEELIIHNNLLISYLIQSNMQLAKDEFSYLKNSDFENFHYGEFLQMCYQNLRCYCITANNKDEEIYYENKIKDLINNPSTSAGTKRIADAMLQGNGIADIFYSQFPYRIEFLCYWGLPTELDVSDIFN